jgi:hypothetical protein
MRKVSQLKGKDLDRAVAQVINSGDISPSTNWAQGGPIMEHFKIECSFIASSRQWAATTHTDLHYSLGDTMLEAAMRQVVWLCCDDVIELEGDENAS